MAVAGIVALTVPLGAAVLLVYLIVLIRRRRHASLGKTVLAIGIITSVVNTAIGATEYNPGDIAGVFVLFWMPPWGFLLGAFGTLVVWLVVSQLQLTKRQWKLLGAFMLLLAIAAAIPFNSAIVPAIRLTLVDDRGAPVSAACASESWSYELLDGHYEVDRHRVGADGRITLPAHVVRASAMSRLANFWILGRPSLLNPNASVNVFSTDSGQHYLVARADSVRVRELRLVMHPDIYAFDHPHAWYCADPTDTGTTANAK
jgi:hypothetical protein